MSGCSICGAMPVKAFGYCSKHYLRFKKHGDPHIRLKQRDTGTLEERFHAKHQRVEETGCFEWQANIDKKGYGTFSIGRGTYFAHRVAYELHTGAKIPPGQVVRHKCDNPRCVNPEHLELGTQADNLKDMDEKRRRKVGESHPHSILTDDIVRLIRADQRRVREIARDLGIAHQVVSSVRLGKTWRHVE